MIGVGPKCVVDDLRTALVADRVSELGEHAQAVQVAEVVREVGETPLREALELLRSDFDRSAFGGADLAEVSGAAGSNVGAAAAGDVSDGDKSVSCITHEAKTLL